MRDWPILTTYWVSIGSMCCYDLLAAGKKIGSLLILSWQIKAVSNPAQYVHISLMDKCCHYICSMYVNPSNSGGNPLTEIWPL